MELKDHIRIIPDFPKPGVLFYDISTLLADPGAWAATVGGMERAVAPVRPEVLVGIESRGFLVAAPLALEMGLGCVMLRKQGKLPGATISHSYDLEYGQDTIEVQADAVAPGRRVVVVDDLLATGGTMKAATQLLGKLGAEVTGAACIVELSFLHGRDNLDTPVEALVSYDA